MGLTKSQALDRANSAAAVAKLGEKLQALMADHNALKAKYALLLAKLDADAGVTDTNYASTLGAGAAIATLDD